MKNTSFYYLEFVPSNLLSVPLLQPLRCWFNGTFSDYSKPLGFDP